MTVPKTALLVGASRTIGLAVAEQLLDRGWDVIGTVRGEQRTGLHDLADRADGRLRIARVDITDPEQIRALRDELRSESLDLVFVNAGIAEPDRPVGDIDTSLFTTVMVTNALGPMRVLEQFHSLVADDGALAVMSSTQGSVSLNTRGGHEVYRASKAALNQLMRSYAARRTGDGRALLIIDPGWVRTDLGGPGAMLSPEASARGVVDTLIKRSAEPGLQFRDHQDQVVPW